MKKKPWNYQKVDINCFGCHKIFAVSPYRKDTARYCSMKCAKTSIVLSCFKCGSKIEVYISRSKANRRVFCSQECRRFGQIKNCLTCNKEIYVKLSNMNKGKGKYCSKKCKGMGWDSKGKNNPKWIGGKAMLNCITCSRIFDSYISPSSIIKGGGRFCSKKCLGGNRALFPKRKCTGKVITCNNCNKKFYMPPSQITKIMYCSLDCEYKGRVGRVTGKDCHFWRGGITPLRNQIRGLHESVIWRRNVFKRDNYTCQKCGYRGKGLQADHFPLSFAQLLEMCEIKTLNEAKRCYRLWNEDNGRTLCKPCHKLTPTYLKPLREHGIIWT